MDGTAEPVAPDTQSIEQEGAQLRAQVTTTETWDDSDEAVETAQSPEKADSQPSSDSGADAGAKDKSETVTDKDDSSTRSAEPSAEAEGPKSSYQARKGERDKLADDQARLAKNWQEFSEGKLKWQQEQNHRFEAMQRQLAQALESRNQAPQQEPTHEDYLKAAKEFEQKAKVAAAEGNVEEADKYITLASRSRDASRDSYQKLQQTQAQQHQSKFLQEYWNNAKAEVDKWPELGDPNQGVGLEAREMWEQNPEFHGTPNGYSKLVQVLKWKREAAESSALRESNKQLETRLQELEQRTSIRGSGPQQPSGAPDFDSMSLDQQRAFLRRGANDDDQVRWRAM